MCAYRPAISRDILLKPFRDGIEIGRHVEHASLQSPELSLFAWCGGRQGPDCRYRFGIARDHDLVAERKLIDDLGKMGLGFLNRDRLHDPSNVVGKQYSSTSAGRPTTARL